MKLHVLTFALLIACSLSSRIRLHQRSLTSDITVKGITCDGGAARVKRSDKCEIELTSAAEDLLSKKSVHLREGKDCSGPIVLTAVQSETVAAETFKYTFTSLPGGSFTVCACSTKDECTVVKDIEIRDDILTSQNVAKTEVAAGVTTWDNIKGDLDLSASTLTPILEHIQSLANEIQAEDEENKVAIQRLSDLREEHEQHRDNLQNQSSQLEQLSEELQQNLEEKAKVTDTANDLKDVVSELQQVQEELRESNHSASQDFQNMDEMLNQWMEVFDECGAMEEKKMHIKKLQEKLAIAEAENAETLETLTELEAEEQAVQKQVEQVMQALADEEAELKQQEEDLEKMELQKNLMIDIRLEAVVKVFRMTTGIDVSSDKFDSFHPSDAKQDMERILGYEGQSVENLLNNQEEQLKYVGAINELCLTHFKEKEDCVSNRWIAKVNARFAERSSFFAQEEIGSSFLEMNADDELDPTSAGEVFAAFRQTYTSETPSALADKFAAMMDKTKSRLELVASQWTELRKTYVRYGLDEQDKTESLAKKANTTTMNKESISKTQTSIKETQAEIEQVEQDIREEKAKVDNAKSNIVDLNDKIKQLKVTQENVIRGNDNLESDISALEQQTAETEEMIRESVAELDQGCRDALKGKDDVLGDKLKAALEIVEEWNGEGPNSLAQMNQDVEDLKANTLATQEVTQQRKDAIAKTNKAIASMQQLIVETNKQLDETAQRTRDCLAAQQDLAKLSDDLERMMQQYIDIMQEHASRYDQIHAAFKSRGELNTITKELEVFLHKYDMNLERAQKKDLECGREDIDDVLRVMGIVSNPSIKGAMDGSLVARVEEICDHIDGNKTTSSDPFSYCYGAFDKDDEQWKVKRDQKEIEAFKAKTGRQSYQEAQRMKIEEKIELLKGYVKQATTTCSAGQQLADAAHECGTDIPKVDRKLKFAGIKGAKSLDTTGVVEGVTAAFASVQGDCKQFCGEVADFITGLKDKCTKSHDADACDDWLSTLGAAVRTASGVESCASVE